MNRSTPAFFCAGTTGLCLWLAIWTGTLSGSCQSLSPALPATPGRGAAGTATDSVFAAAHPQYQVNKASAFFLGKHYRDVWATPLTIPRLDLRHAHGGLSPVERGGGMQTLSLHLQGGDGMEYVLRSVNKNPENILPKVFRRTLPAYLLQDQISASHPYGALVVPPLARAAGILHMVPQLVYVPDDSLLGAYRQEFGKTIALLEAKPKEEATPPPGWEGVHKVVSTGTLWAKIHQDDHHRVDGPAFARARLFDMWLGDWDRHEDQWRWAAYAEAGGTVYRPVPRDRDQVFFRFDGLLPYLAGREWGERRFQNFGYTFPDLKGLNYNGRRLDRMLLTGLSLADWQDAALRLQAALTDSVIRNALHQWPAPVYALHGREIEARLKARRALLPRVAADYYRLLARQVQVTGSRKADLFEVERLDAGRSRVRVYALDPQGQAKDLHYDRTFDRRDTREICLYGLEGDDRFLVGGMVRKGIRVRIIGGPGADQLVDSSRVGGLARKTLLYDSPADTRHTASRETARRLSADPAVNRYDSLFQYNVARPLLLPGYNVDDGIYLGGGVSLQQQGFRKTPYAASHTVAGNFAWKTQAFNFRYEGHFKAALGRWDLGLAADVRAPNYVYNYYGLGNQTLQKEEEDLPVSRLRYYRLRFNQAVFTPTLSRQLSPATKVEAGLRYTYARVRRLPDRFLTFAGSGLSEVDFEPDQYLGGFAGLHYDHTDRKALPRRGVRGNFTAGAYKSLTDQKRFVSLQGQASAYWSPDLDWPFTVAFRVGGSTNLGTFDFYQASTLGGITNLRGYRRTRFSGRSALYQNTELRIRLLEFRTFLTRGQFGVLGLNDVGRVWADGERSTKWHHGYGGGVWLMPFNLAVLSATYTFSEEGSLPNVYLGFFF